MYMYLWHIFFDMRAQSTSAVLLPIYNLCTLLFTWFIILYIVHLFAIYIQLYIIYSVYTHFFIFLHMYILVVFLFIGLPIWNIGTKHDVTRRRWTSTSFQYLECNIYRILSLSQGLMYIVHFKKIFMSKLMFIAYIYEYLRVSITYGSGLVYKYPYTLLKSTVICVMLFLYALLK